MTTKTKSAKDVDTLDPVRVAACDEVFRLVTEEGWSQNKAGKQEADKLGISKAALSTWAKRNYLPLPTSMTAPSFLTKQFQNYAKGNRLELGNKLMELVERQIEVQLIAARDGKDTFSPRELKELVTAYAILVDKRRLEDGDATERREVQTSHLRQQVRDRIDELAERREHRETG